jgi:uncharacterized protein (TIRG00374 family)
LNKTLAAVLRYVVFAGIAAGLLLYIFREEDINKLLEQAKKMNYSWILLSMMVSVPAYFIRAWRWNLLLNSLGYKTTLVNSTKAVSIGYLANLAFPRLGEVTRCTILNRTNKIPLNTLIGTVVAERAIDVICLLILIFTVVVLRLETLGQFLIHNFFNPIGQKIGNAATNPVFIIVALVGLAAIIFGFRYLIRSSKFGAKLRGFVADFTSGLTAVFRLKKLRLFLVLTLFMWVVYFLMMYVCFFGIPVVASLGFVDSLFLFVMGSIGMAAPTPGGAGTYEFAIVEALKFIGIAASQGLVLATVFHLSQIATTCILGVGSLLTLPSKHNDGQATSATQ